MPQILHSVPISNFSPVFFNPSVKENQPPVNRQNMTANGVYKSQSNLSVPRVASSIGLKNLKRPANEIRHQLLID